MIDKLAMDQVQDVSGVQLVKYAQEFDLPDYVKSADLSTIRDPQGLPATVYADALNRLYPCHTSAATYLSYLYFQDKVAHYAPAAAEVVKHRLDEAAAVWGICGDIKAAQVRHAEMTKIAEANYTDDDYAFVWQGDNGRKIHQLLITTPEQVKAAAAWLQKYRDEIPYTDRNVIATKLIDKAASMNVDFGELETFIERQAGRGFCSPKEVVAAVRQRASLTSNPAFRTEIEKMAQMVAGKPAAALTPDMLVKMAATLEGLDRSFGVKPGDYGELLRRPEDIVFSTTLKQASEAVGSAVALTTGNTFDSNDFAKIGKQLMVNEMGEGFTGEVFDAIGQLDTTKLADLASTLPVPDAEAFERVLKQAGIPPAMAKTAASVRRGPDTNELERLAASY